MCYPEGVPETFVLPEHSQIIAQSDTAVLLELSEPMYPFYEQRAKQLLESIENENCRIFSMAETESFLKQLPWVAVLVVCLLIPVVIWICSSVMVKAAYKYRYLLMANVGITVIFLLETQGILGQIDFPASLMPVDNIFDISHYAQMFSFIVNAQSTLGESGQTIAMLLSEVNKAVVCIWGIGAFVCIVVIVLEILIARKIHKSNYVVYIPTKQRETGYIQELDL